MTEIRKGKLVIRSIPTQSARVRVVEYISSLKKKTPKERIHAFLEKTPVTLAKQISAARGQKIAQELMRLGAVAVFEEEGVDKDATTPEQTPNTISEQYQGPENGKNPPGKPMQVRQMVSRGILAILVLVLGAVWYFKPFDPDNQSSLYSSQSKQNQPIHNSQTRNNSPQENYIFTRLIPVTAASPSAVAVKPQDMMEAYLYQFRFRPDKRLMSTYSVLLQRYGQLTGGPSESYKIGEIKSDGKHLFIPLVKNDIVMKEMILQLPLQFAEVKHSLASMLDLMDTYYSKEPPIKNSATEEEIESFQTAMQNIHMVDPRYIVQALSTFEQLWHKGFDKAKLLKASARAYAMLLLVTDKGWSHYEDNLAVEALTCLILAQHFDKPGNTESEEFLIAMNMGYRAYADTIVSHMTKESGTPEDKILSAYMQKDLKALKQLSGESESALAKYLLSRHYREIGLFKEAEHAGADLLKSFPTLYPSVVENIIAGQLSLAKILTVLYPLDILKNIESSVSLASFINIKSWVERISGFSGDILASNISFTEFDSLLAKWEPYENPQDYQFIIDSDRLKDVFRLLYTNAVYYRFNILFNRWGVVEKAKSFVDSFSGTDTNHPLVSWMQGEVYTSLGDKNSTKRSLGSILNHPDSTGRVIYEAFLAVHDDLERLRLTPTVADRIDGRPKNRVLMGYLLESETQNYDLAAKYYESGLSQDPYQFWVYRYLSHIKGSTDPLSTALQKSPYSFLLLEQAGEYFAYEGDRLSLEKAASVYNTALELAPSRVSLARNYSKVLLKLEQFEEAIAVLDRWLEEYGGNGLDSVITRSYKADIYLTMGKPDLALISLGSDIESYQAGVILNIARAYEDLGQIDKAEHYYQKVLERYPTVGDIIAEVAGFYWRKNEYEPAAQLISHGRKIYRNNYRWYLKEFITAIKEKEDESVLQAINSLQNTGATPAELKVLCWELTSINKYDVAFKVVSGMSSPSMMENLEHIVTAYKLMLQWKGEERASAYLNKTITAQQKGPLMMVLYNEGLYKTIVDEIGDPDSYRQYREFMWLQLLIAWLFMDRQPGDLEKKILVNYRKKSSDHYHLLGQYLLGSLSLESILNIINNQKQRCEITYYLGLKERLEGNFAQASYWYQICRQTMLQNNGEFHWASNELFWWAHMGLENRHRLVTKDIETYRKKESMKIIPQALPVDSKEKVTI